MSFPRYPEYKDSGIEWLGLVPEHWSVKQLRYLGRFRKGLTITKADLTDAGIPCLNYGEVHSLYPFDVNQDIQPLRNVPVEYLETEPSACVSYGDFVFADTSEDLDGVGNFTHVSGKGPLFAGYHTIIYSLDSEVSSRFLAYCLDSFAFRAHLRMGVKGVKVFSITQEILRGGVAWLPAVLEQGQIARFLDHETAKIDALIAEQQRLIELLKEKRQAVISHAVTKGLNPNAPMKDSGVEWLGEVPAHWDVRKGGHIGLLFGSEAVPENMINESGNLPFLKVASLAENSLHIKQLDFFLDPSVEKLCRPRSGFVAFPKRGAAIFLNKVNVVELAALLDPNLMGWEMSAGNNAYYFANILKCRGLSELADVSTVPQINNKHISPEKFPVPPSAEQDEIAAFLDVEILRFENLVVAAEDGVFLLQERRSALISAAVTGKIDVRKWQPPKVEAESDAQTLDMEASL